MHADRKSVALYQLLADVEATDARHDAGLPPSPSVEQQRTLRPAAASTESQNWLSVAMVTASDRPAGSTAMGLLVPKRTAYTGTELWAVVRVTSETGLASYSVVVS